MALFKQKKTVFCIALHNIFLSRKTRLMNGWRGTPIGFCEFKSTLMCVILYCLVSYFIVKNYQLNATYFEIYYLRTLHAYMYILVCVLYLNVLYAFIYSYFLRFIYVRSHCGCAHQRHNAKSLPNFTTVRFNAQSLKIHSMPYNILYDILKMLCMQNRK